MSYKKIQFAECAFNPLEDGSMLENNTKLYDIVESEWRDQYLDSIIRFMIMVYDPKSPLFKGEKELHKRKTIAIELSGFDTEDSEAQKVIADVLNCSHVYFVSLLTEFLKKFVKVKEFAAIIIVESCFWESCGQLMKPISGDNSKVILEAVQKKSAIKDELDKDIARLDKYYKSFFGDDEEAVDVAKGRFSPESVSKRIKSV